MLVGNAGEFFVLAELTRRSWTAALTARNNHAFDIMAAKGDVSVKLRVKTKTRMSDVFQWNAKKDGAIFLELSKSNDFCVLVDIPLDETGPAYYVVPTHVIDSWLRKDFDTWLKTPGAKGQAHSADNSRRLFYADAEDSRLGHGYAMKLKPYLNAWRLLEQNRNPG
ncbi:MAG: hypothetical protein ACRD24_07400 [Terriglobales bacterium]